jgi:hypothetical protein
MAEYHCTASNDDGQAGNDANSNATTMIAEWSLLLSPNVISSGYANIDTSAIGTDEITAATLYWYTEADIKYPKAETFDKYIKIGSTVVWSSTSIQSAGWASHALTAGELALINKSGDTAVTFHQVEPTQFQGFRRWTLRTWDYTPNGDYSVYLVITHAAAGGPTKMTILGV